MAHYIKEIKISLPLETTNKIIEAALRVGREAQLLPLTVAVLDSGGHLLSFQREDGSGILRGDIAFGKAWGALGMGVSSRTISERLGKRIAFQGALSSASQGRFVPVPGGVLICDNEGKVIGSIGISGDASDKDEYCAIQAVKSVGLLSHPEEPVPDWEKDSL